MGVDKEKYLDLVKQLESETESLVQEGLNSPNNWYAVDRVYYLRDLLDDFIEDNFNV